MNIRRSFLVLALLLSPVYADAQSMSVLDSETKATKQRIAEAQEERKSYGEGSVVHELITLRIVIHEQTLAMLEQRRAAGKARVRLSYAVDGKAYRAPAEAAAETKRLEDKVKEVRAARERDVQQIKESEEPFRPLYIMSAGTKAIQLAQLEYQLAAYRHGFPPYYVPFHPPAPGATPPQTITVPAGKSVVVH